jgi:hypothetical protein
VWAEYASLFTVSHTLKVREGHYNLNGAQYSNIRFEDSGKHVYSFEIVDPGVIRAKFYTFGKVIKIFDNLWQGSQFGIR